MNAGDTGRRMAYLRWPQEELAHAMVQAEDDIKELRDRLREAEEERDQYGQESRDNARVLGGILRVLRDNGVGGILDLEVPGDAPNLARLGARQRRFTRHVKVSASEGASYDVCSCGSGWLVGPDACVTEHSEYVNQLSRERAERSSWSPPSFSGGAR